MAIPQLDVKALPNFADWRACVWSGTEFWIFPPYADPIKSANGVEGTWVAVSVGAADTLSMWFNGVAVNGAEIVVVSNGGDGESLATDDGGATWYNGTLTALSSWTAAATDGAGKWVAVAESGFANRAASSVDVGATWTLRPSLDTTIPWECVVWTGTQFVAGSADGYISKSADGVTWGAPIALTSAAIKNFFIDPVSGRVHANCGFGVPEIRYSDDGGNTWTTVIPPFESLDNAAGLYKDGLLMIGSSAPNTAYTTDIAAVAFEIGDNPFTFDPSAATYGTPGGVPTGIFIGRFSDQYIYGTGFQPSGVLPDDCFFHFTF